MFWAFAVSLIWCVMGQPASEDLKRARQWTPRAEYRGQGTLASANARLNKHLSSKTGITLKACEDFHIEGLRGLLRDLLPRTSMELKALYAKADGRSAKHKTIAE